jgi:hypothetical protein
VAVLLAGCTSGVKRSIDRINRNGESYSGLQNFIRTELTTKFHRSVRSVACTPHVDQVLPTTKAKLICVITFTDGSSYVSPAVISDPSTAPDLAVNNFSFQDPPAVDITTAPLPRPTVSLAATSSMSLFTAHRLTQVLARLATRVGHHGLFVQLAIYPGGLEAVLVGHGGQAQAVSVSYTGAVTVGPPVSFAGSRNGITFGQLVPAVISA